VNEYLLALITVVSFVIALWQVIRAYEYKKVMKQIREISGSYKDNNAKSFESTLRAINVIASSHLGDVTRTTKENLIERNIIIPQNDINVFENDSSVTEVWLVTPDLEPDLSSRQTGDVVEKNIKRGVKYIYFYKKSLELADTKQKCLLKNILVDQSTKENVDFIPLPDDEFREFFLRHNNMLFVFHGGNNDSFRCFEELCLSRVNERGAFWQEHSIHIFLPWQQKLVDARNLSNQSANN